MPDEPKKAASDTPIEEPKPAQTVKVFDEEEVKRLVSKARQEEKEKLYSDLERQKKALKESEDRIKAMEAELSGLRVSSSEAQRLAGEIERLKAERAAESERFQKTIEEVLEKTRRETEKQLRSLELAALKRELIASAQGRVIPELVHGETEEEIRDSFDASKRRFEQIAAEVEARAKKEHEEKMKSALPKPASAGSANDAPETPLGDLSAWRRMSPQEWEKHKEEIKRAAFEKAGLPLRAR